MPEFLVEQYIASTDAPAVGLALERARRGAAAVSTERCPVRCLRAIVVPEDETCLLLFEAQRASAVRAAAQAAGLRADHVVAAFTEAAT
jgi:hypothetical protein